MLVVVELVEVEAGLLALKQVGVEGAALVAHDERRRRLAVHRPLDLVEAFGLAHAALVALDDAAGGKDLHQGLDDQLLALRHRQGQGLQHQVVAVAVDDDAGQAVGLAPDQAAELRIDPGLDAAFQRALDAADEEVEVEVLAAVREQPGADLRLRIVDGAAQRLATRVLELHDVARLGVAVAGLDLGRVDPDMTVKNAGARLNGERGHGRGAGAAGRRINGRPGRSRASPGW